MHDDEIDEMFTSAVPIPHPGRWCGLDEKSSRSLTGHFEGRRGEVYLQTEALTEEAGGEPAGATAAAVDRTIRALRADPARDETSRRSED